MANSSRTFSTFPSHAHFPGDPSLQIGNLLCGCVHVYVLVVARVCVCVCISFSVNVSVSAGVHVSV